MSLPKIAVTMGDPAGVGPEICLDLLSNQQVNSQCTPIIFGDLSVLRQCAEKTGKPLPPSNSPSIRDLSQITPAQFIPGTINAATGAATYHYITTAIDACLRGDVDAVTTAPANKEALQAAGVRHPGHTEIFAERTRTDRFCMLQTSPEVSCSFVTVHVGYAEVPALLTTDRILEVIELTRHAMHRIRGHEPRLLVCGLNPHAGEHGLFGNREEEELILPAIEQARANGCQIEGPLPPDTAFIPHRRATSDAVVCMYHDQGHIPLKALAFDQAVNCTLGLPIIRTSVDHGTALDIAWQNQANPGSLIQATLLAAKLSS